MRFENPIIGRHEREHLESERAKLLRKKNATSAFSHADAARLDHIETLIGPAHSEYSDMLKRAAEAVAK
jgi:hypothetical protein